MRRERRNRENGDTERMGTRGEQGMQGEPAMRRERGSLRAARKRCPAGMGQRRARLSRNASAPGCSRGHMRSASVQRAAGAEMQVPDKGGFDACCVEYRGFGTEYCGQSGPAYRGASAGKQGENKLTCGREGSRKDASAQGGIFERSVSVKNAAGLPADGGRWGLCGRKKKCFSAREQSGMAAGVCPGRKAPGRREQTKSAAMLREGHCMRESRDKADGCGMRG